MRSLHIVGDVLLKLLKKETEYRNKLIQGSESGCSAGVVPLREAG